MIKGNYSMNIELVDLPLTSVEADFTITLLNTENFSSHPAYPSLVHAGFEAKAEQSCTLHERREIVLGIANYVPDEIRDTIASAIKTVQNFHYESVRLSTYGQINAAAVVEGIILGSYRFERYKTEPKVRKLTTVKFSNDDHDGRSLDYEILERTIAAAKIIAHATNFTRNLVNTTPEDMTPGEMVVVASDLAKANAMTCDVYDEHALEEQKMFAMLSVGRASRHKPRLIHVAYKPKTPKMTISLVGKGLTYDSGGLSLKPTSSMVTMKMDKSGACAVLGILKAVSELQLPIEVHGFIGAVENMIGGNAYKNDDVLIARNGTTIEVRNTDAEGRLVLADVLCFAQDNVKADYLFDFATLTGACMVALGPYTSGVMGHNAELKDHIGDAAQKSGELVGFLPFNKYLGKLLKSEIADVCNVGPNSFGGAITAALFLDKFITEEMKEKWMHFDVAGSAYTEKPWGVHSYGGTGSGVRLATEFIRKLADA